jgi:hypothetical protein
VSKVGVIQLTTTPSSFSLTTEIERWGLWVTPEGGRSLTTVASSFNLTAENALSRYVYQVSSSASFSLTASSATLDKAVIGNVVLTTVSSSISLTAVDVTSRMFYQVYGAASFSFTASSAELIVPRTTIYTYAPAISASLSSTTSVLDWDSPNIRLTTLASSTSLTVTTANYALARTIYTYAPAISASLTALPAATYPGLAKWLTTTLSSVSLSATSAPMTKTNSGTPTIKLLTTVASTFLHRKPRSCRFS